MDQESPVWEMSAGLGVEPAGSVLSRAGTGPSVEELRLYRLRSRCVSRADRLVGGTSSGLDGKVKGRDV